MFSKILVGIDGSEHSKNAAQYAIDLFRKYDSEVIFLLSIVPSKVHHGDSSGVFGMVSPAFLQEYTAEANEWFKEIKDKIDKANADIDEKIKTEVISTPFSIAAAILNYAEERDVDLIVIGTRGNSGLKKLLLGSVASEIVTYSYCPVMVIK